MGRTTSILFSFFRRQQYVVLILLLCGLFWPATLQAQPKVETPPTVVTTIPPAAAGTKPINRTAPTEEARSVSYMTDRELIQTAAFLLFGIVVLIIEYLLLRATNADAEQILRIFSMTLILNGTLIAISAGFRLEQTSGAIGLFGTVAGYILGRQDAKKN